MLRALNLEVIALLGCYAAYVGNCLPKFRDSLSLPSSRVKQSKKNAGKHEDTLRRGYCVVGWFSVR